MKESFSSFVFYLKSFELPLQHLVTHYLGETSGPNSFKSDLGKKIVELKQPEIVNFTPIPTDELPEIPDDVIKDLSRDQNLLYRTTRAVMSGICPQSLASATLGPVSHSRWLTLAVRILVYYMSLAVPPYPIKRLANFIVNIYVPQWFNLRLHWRATDAPRILFNGLRAMLKLPVDEQEVVLPVFQ